MESLKQYVKCLLFIVVFNFILRTSGRMDRILVQETLRKGEHAAEFAPQKGVNMDGSTKKRYKEKEYLKRKIIQMREKMFLN